MVPLPFHFPSPLQVCCSGDAAALQALCTPDMQPTAATRFAAMMGEGVKIGRMHTCVRSCTVFVELQLSSGIGMLSLTFNDEGLVSSADVFAKA